jgi:anhydro-N-acetylmuramic acid kinase
MEKNRQFGLFIGENINKFLNYYNLEADLIASHGHTIFHQPEKGITYQLGEGASIAFITGITTISDFRAQDVAYGGQGAPLVPVGDEYLFGEYTFCLNLGGFANISFKENQQRIAFDICPVNIVINYLAEKVGKSMDENGQIASAGNIKYELLDELNRLDYYNKPYPKSLSREWFEDIIIPVLNGSNCSIEDKIRTVNEHISDQVTRILNSNKIGKVLITGGGTYNSFLLHLIGSKTDISLVIPGKFLIEYKEALVFALLGVLRINNEVNCFSSVTGARFNHSSGVINLINEEFLNRREFF